MLAKARSMKNVMVLETQGGVAAPRYGRLIKTTEMPSDTQQYQELVSDAIIQVLEGAEP